MLVAKDRNLNKIL